METPPSEQEGLARRTVSSYRLHVCFTDASMGEGKLLSASSLVNKKKAKQPTRRSFNDWARWCFSQAMMNFFGIK